MLGLRKKKNIYIIINKMSKIARDAFWKGSFSDIGLVKTSFFPSRPCSVTIKKINSPIHVMWYFFVEDFHHSSESKTILPVAYHRYFPAFASLCVAIGWSISRHFRSQLYTKPKPIIQSLLVFYLYNVLAYIIYMLTLVLVSRHSTEVTKVCLVCICKRA